MSPVRIRPRSAIADAELARVATVDLPGARDVAPRLGRPSALVGKLAAFRRPIEPERVIVMTLAPARARR